MKSFKSNGKYIDIWSLMPYDYSEGWDTIAGHDANVHKSTKARPALYSTPTEQQKITLIM